MATEIVSLAEVKKFLNKTSNADDAELKTFIAAATPIVEHYVGPVVDQTITERHHRVIALFKPPVKSLTSVVAVHSTGTSWDVSALDVDPDTGIVTRLNGSPLYGGPWDVTYEAGRTVVADNIKKGAKIIIKHIWETQRGQMAKLPVGGGIDNVPVSSGVSYAVPRRALELLRPDDTIAGLA